tara:strand:+ start:153 stop:488 length:336 start_codon:yes stop_codon:yes gene_type:complete
MYHNMSEMKAIIDTKVLSAGLCLSQGASFQVLRAIDQGRVRIVLSCEFNFQVHLSWSVKKQRSTGIFPLSIHTPHVEEQMKEYSQLTLPQRYEISALHKAGRDASRNSTTA